MFVFQITFWCSTLHILLGNIIIIYYFLTQTLLKNGIMITSKTHSFINNYQYWENNFFFLSMCMCILYSCIFFIFFFLYFCMIGTSVKCTNNISRYNFYDGNLWTIPSKFWRIVIFWYFTKCTYYKCGISGICVLFFEKTRMTLRF